MDSLIDAFGTYAVEECFLSKLAKIFTPEIVTGMGDDAIERIAEESHESTVERKDLKQKLEVLEKARKELARLDRHKVTSMLIPRPRILLRI